MTATVDICPARLRSTKNDTGVDVSTTTGDKVAQLVGCRTSNQRVAGSIPDHSGHFGRSWARQFIPYCFSLPSCKMGT